MDQQHVQHMHDLDNEAGKQPWREPKLTFVEPKLTEHGMLEEVTGGFFGGFTP
jgi:hypothetical protein